MIAPPNIFQTVARLTACHNAAYSNDWKCSKLQLTVPVHFALVVLTNLKLNTGTVVKYLPFLSVDGQATL